MADIETITVDGTTYDIAMIGAGGIDYSTTEQNTGLDWIDGKTIYQKTVSINSITNGTTVLQSVDTLINAFGSAQYSNGNYLSVPYTYTTNYISFYLTNSNVTFDTNLGTMSNFKVTFIYTKS